MDDNKLFGGSTSDSDLFGFSGGSSLPDPATPPSSYDDSFLNGSSTTLGGLDSIPDPAASPDSYQDFDIPEIDSDFDVPSVDDVVVPEPAVVTPPPAAAPRRTAVEVPPPVIPQPSVIPQQVLPQKPKDFDFSSDDNPMPSVEAPKPVSQTAKPVQDAESDEFSGHMSWNGSQYVESAAPSYNPPRPVDNNAPKPAHFTMEKQNGNTYGAGSDAASQINTIRLLGIVGIVGNVIGCGCGFIGVILGAIGLNKAKSLEASGLSMTDNEKSQLKTARVLCIISIVLSLLGFLSSFIIGFFSAFI